MRTHCKAGLLATGVLAGVIVLSGCNKPADINVPSVANQVIDADVTTNVKTALLRESTLNGLNISVTTLKGDVRLMGIVDNQTQVDTALKVARAADGAHTIHDELSIKK